MHAGSILASHSMWSKELHQDRFDSAAAYYFWVPTGRLALTFLLLPSYKLYKSFSIKIVWRNSSTAL